MICLRSSSSRCLARRSSISLSLAAVSTGRAPPKMAADALAGAGATGAAAAAASLAGASTGTERGLSCSFLRSLGPESWSRSEGWSSDRYRSRLSRSSR
uniref:Putative secreted protein n=1 Tax=Ixodes ricinus TaxID=34613 RepID=A0A6B0UED0_IXORI